MDGGGGTTVQKADPWAGQQPFLQDTFGEAQALYNQQIGTDYYPGMTVAPFAPHTELGMNLMTERALMGSPQQDAMGGYLLNTLGQGQIDPYAIASGGFNAMRGIQPGMSLAYGAGQPIDFGTARSMYGNVIPGTAPIAGQQIAQTAGGGYLGSNPYLDQMYQTAADKVTQDFSQNIMPTLNQTFGGAGRTGGGLHQLYAGEAAGEAQDALAGLAADIYAPAYEAERDRQMQAAGMGTDLFAQMNQADLARRMGAADMFSTGLDRGVQAGLGIGDLGMAGMGGLTDLYGGMGDAAYRAAAMVPSYTGLQYGDIENLMKVGAITQDQAQNLIDAEKARFDFYQQAPWQSLGQYSSIVQGMPAGYGTTTATGPDGNPVLGALGGGLSGAALAPMLGIAGPWGMAAGAALGLLAS